MYNDDDIIIIIIMFILDVVQVSIEYGIVEKYQCYYLELNLKLKFNNLWVMLYNFFCQFDSQYKLIKLQIVWYNQ